MKSAVEMEDGTDKRQYAGRLHLCASFSARCCWRSTSPRKRWSNLSHAEERAKPLRRCTAQPAPRKLSGNREAVASILPSY